jgi:antitoxin component of MazEF toxin-antitoxin module
VELQFNRWGNSLAVRLPVALARDIGVNEGSSLTPREFGERLLALQDSEHDEAVLTRKKLLVRLRKLHKQIPVTQPVSKDDMARY